METWADFKAVIHKWKDSDITHDQFHDYLRDSEFETPADERVAKVFLEQLDDGSYHGHFRMH